MGRTSGEGTGSYRSVHGGDTSSGTRGVLRRVGPFLFARVFVAAVAFPALVRGPALAAVAFFFVLGLVVAFAFLPLDFFLGFPALPFFLGPAPAFVLAFFVLVVVMPGSLHHPASSALDARAPVSGQARGAIPTVLGGLRGYTRRASPPILTHASAARIARSSPARVRAWFRSQPDIAGSPLAYRRRQSTRPSPRTLTQAYRTARPVP